MKIRQWVQWFIGVLSLEKKAKERHADAIFQEAAHHNELMTVLAGISERLGRLENRFQDQHVGTRRETPEIYDWDQVQARFYAEMMKNIPKEDS